MIALKCVLSICILWMCSDWLKENNNLFGWLVTLFLLFILWI